MNVGVLLAAGASSRMGSSKPLVRWKGQSFLAHGVRTLWAACDIVIVVLGADAKRVQKGIEDEFTLLVEAGALTPDLHAARKHGARGLELRFEIHRGWKKGMLSSAQAGLAAAVKLKPASVLVLPVDHPEVKAETVQQLVAMMAQAMGSFGSKAAGGFAYALVPRHRRRRGHPIVLSPALARVVAKERDARDLADAVRGHARLIGYHDVADGGVVRNRNTPAR